MNNSPARLRSPPTYLPARWIGLNKYLPRYTITQSHTTTTTYLGTVQGWAAHLSYPRFSFYLQLFAPRRQNFKTILHFRSLSHLWVCIGKNHLAKPFQFLFCVEFLSFISFFSFPRNQLDTVRDVQLLNRESKKGKRKKKRLVDPTLLDLCRHRPRLQRRSSLLLSILLSFLNFLSSPLFPLLPLPLSNPKYSSSIELQKGGYARCSSRSPDW